jgi:uncharacterized Zn-finger protein
VTDSSSIPKYSLPGHEPTPITAANWTTVSTYQSEYASSNSSHHADESKDNTRHVPAFELNSIESVLTSVRNILSGARGSTVRRRRRGLPTLPPKAGLAEEVKIFQCTFCTESFKVKYDWLRHEKSLHLSMEKWTCAPLGRGGKLRTQRVAS